jgi:hypothetical protein
MPRPAPTERIVASRPGAGTRGWLKLEDLGLLNHPASRALAEVRWQALDRLRVRHQGINPFKFIVYSEWAQTDLAPVGSGSGQALGASET